MSAFRGTWALLLEKRRQPLRALLTGLAFGLFTGLFLRLSELGERDVIEFLLVFFLAAAVVTPFASGGAVTFSGLQAGARSRRDELFTLPVGRLAIPASILLGSAVVLAVCTVGLLLGTGLFVGFDELERVYAFGASKGTMGFVAASGAACFSLAFAVVAIGPHAALLGVLWFLLPIALVGVATGTGCGEAELLAWIKLWTASIVGYQLVLPFALYAGPPHRFAAVNARVDGTLVAGAACLLLTLGVLGAGTALAVVGLVTVAATAREVRRAPPRCRELTLLQLGLVLALAAVGPPFLLGLAADARHVAEAGKTAGKRPVEVSVAPDGRSLVALFREGTSAEPGAPVRAVLADLDGVRPPRVLGARIARLPAGCWSSDGRFLAVDDDCVGRVLAERPHFDVLTGREVHWVGVAGATFKSMLLVDARTGEADRIGLREVAPGWTTAAELPTLGTNLAGALVLRGPEGPWLTTQGTLVVERLGASPVVRDGGRFRSVGPAASDGWFYAGFERVPVAEEDAAEAAPVWRNDLVRPGPEGPRAKVGVEGTSPIAWIGSDSVVLTDRTGLVRVSLPGGERRVLVAGSKVRVPDALRLLQQPDADRRILVRVGAERLLVDPVSGLVAPLAVSPGFEPEVVAGTRVVGRGPKGEVLVRDGDAAPRPVFPD